MQRGFLTLANRRIHFRWAGSGPPVLLLHGSPQSSRAVIPLMERVAVSGCTAIAPDNPGNGLSDPLEGLPHSADLYCDAILACLDKLGLDRVAIYGFHTGAVFACLMGLKAPDRVSGLVLDGLPVWSPDERQDLLANYLPAFQPSWDGAHMAWAWARIEEQSWFFPWYAHTQDGWMNHQAASTEAVHANALDYMAAGRKADATYASAFEFEGARALDLRIPAVVCAGAADPLAAHLDRLAWPQNITIVRHQLDRMAALDDIAQKLCAQAVGTSPIFPSQSAQSLRFHEGPFGPFMVRKAHPEAQSARLVPIAQSALSLPEPEGDDAWLELPGHGVSAGPSTPLQDRAALERAVAQCLRAADLQGDAATLLAALALDRAAPPPVMPAWDGTHLLTAWRWARRQALFDPWDKPAKANARLNALPLQLGAIQTTALDLLRAGPHAHAAWHALAKPS